jgi:hypothetical protein
MSFKTLYTAVQQQKGVVSTKWLKEQAIALSSINRVKEQWSGVLDTSSLRGFYIEGPIGPPVPLDEDESLIVLSRSMCSGPLGDHWRRFVYTKELMHVFDEEHEKTSTRVSFDSQIEKFGDPSQETSPQYRAELKAFYRALMVLCPEERRLQYKREIDGSEISIDVVASALRIPVGYARSLMHSNFQLIADKLK